MGVRRGVRRRGRRRGRRGARPGSAGRVKRVQPLDAGFRVGFAVNHLGQQVAAGLGHPVPHHHGKVHRGVARRRLRGGYALVFLLDLALFEEHLVLAPGLGIRGEQQDSGGHAVEAMHGDQVREAELVPEPDQGRFLDVRPAGGGGQEMWLVHDQQVIVLVQDVQLHRDPGLRRQGAVVPDERMVLHRRAAVQGYARLADDLAGVEPVLDALGIDVAPAVHHVVQRRLPGPLVRQAQARRVDSVAHGEGGLHHRTILRVRPPARPAAPAPPARARAGAQLAGRARASRRSGARRSARAAPVCPPPPRAEFAPNVRVRRKLPATSGASGELEGPRSRSPAPPAPPAPAPALCLPDQPLRPSSRQPCEFAGNFRRPRGLPANSRDRADRPADEKKVLDK